MRPAIPLLLLSVLAGAPAHADERQRARRYCARGKYELAARAFRRAGEYLYAGRAFLHVATTNRRKRALLEPARECLSEGIARALRHSRPFLLIDDILKLARTELRLGLPQAAVSTLTPLRGPRPRLSQRSRRRLAFYEGLARYLTTGAPLAHAHLDAILSSVPDPVLLRLLYYSAAAEDRRAGALGPGQTLEKRRKRTRVAGCLALFLEHQRGRPLGISSLRWVATKLFRGGRYREAIAAFQRLGGLNLDAWGALRLGIALLEVGRLSAACKELARAARNPRNLESTGTGSLVRRLFLLQRAQARVDYLLAPNPRTLNSLRATHSLSPAFYAHLAGRYHHLPLSPYRRKRPTPATSSP